MLRHTHIHWQAPTTVIAALLAGTLFAIGHHLFYNSLDGHLAPDDNYDFLGSHVSTQQINIAGGTAFAFLVKACLATAIGAAYAQLFWRAMLHQTPEVNLQRLDATFAALTHIHHLFKVFVWLRYPILFSLAVIAWLIPLASIVTPATLSIKSAPVIPPISRMQQVQNIDLVSMNYLNYMPTLSYTFSYTVPDLPVQYFYNGPSRAVTSLAEAVAAAGSISQFKPPALNSTYSTTFPGPAIRCSDMPTDLVSLVQANIIRVTNTSDYTCSPYGFLAWTPSFNADYELAVPLPFSFSSNGTYELNAAPLSNAAGPVPASLYLAAMPNMMLSSTLGSDHQIVQACVSFQSGDVSSPFANSTYLQCDLHNSTYRADFSFVNGDQDISIQVDPVDDVFTTVYDVFGPLLYPGSAKNASKPSCSTLTSNQNNSCQFDSILLQNLTYQAVFESFNSLLVGSVSIPNSAFSPTFDTNVQNTALIDAPELAFLDQPLSDAGLVSLQQSILASNGTLFKGLYNNQSNTTTKPLSSRMEELFQFITISLMTSHKLQPDQASSFAPSMTNVTLQNYQNVYTYSAWKLWIAYGLAILFTTICVIAGMVTIALNGASYSLSFSTVLRASKCVYTNVQMTEKDGDIRDPLPPRLAKAKIWLGSPSRASEKPTSPVANSAGVNGNTDDGDDYVEANNTGPSSTLLGQQPSEPRDRVRTVSS